MSNMPHTLSSLDNNEKENEESINDVNEEININNNYLKYKIIDKEKKIVNFLYNKYGKESKDVKVKIPLNSYLNIIQRITEIKINIKNDQEEIHLNYQEKSETKEIENKNVKPISIRFYQNFINKLINEINENKDMIRNNHNIFDIISNHNIFLDIQKFDSKINSFKNYILFLLIKKKHYLSSIPQKEKLINDKTKEIEEYKNEIYQYFFDLKNSINSMKDIKYNNQKKKEYIMMIIDILKHYKYINHQDIKLAKKLFKERKSKKRIHDNNTKNKSININIIKNISKKENEAFAHKKTKLFISLSYVFLPLVYIISFLNTYQKDYSLVEK